MLAAILYNQILIAYIIVSHNEVNMICGILIAILTLIPGTSCPQQPNSFNALQGGTANGATSTCWSCWRPGFKLLNCQVQQVQLRKPASNWCTQCLGQASPCRNRVSAPYFYTMHLKITFRKGLCGDTLEVLRRDADAQQWSRALLHTLCTFCSKQSGLGFQHWPSTVQENAKSFCLGRLDPQVPGVWDHRFRAYHRPHCPSRLGNASCLSYLQKISKEGKVNLMIGAPLQTVVK